MLSETPEDAAAVKSKKVDVAEEDVDIGEEIPMGNFPPVVIEKDAAACASSGSSSSGSSSSSSDSSSSSGINPRLSLLVCVYYYNANVVVSGPLNLFISFVGQIRIRVVPPAATRMLTVFNRRLLQQKKLPEANFKALKLSWER